MVLILLTILVVFFLGCNAQEAENLLEEPMEKVEQEEKLAVGEITDSQELEKLWQEYFYHSITTIGNNQGFSSAEEIDPLYVAEFCWFKYIMEHGRESLELAGEDSYNRLLPLDIVLDYAERYFNTTTLDLTKVENRDYDFAKNAFTFCLGSDQEIPSYTDQNSWVIHLDKVTRDSDGTVTAVLVKYDSYRHRRVESTDTYTLKPHGDGSLYFVSCQRDYVNNNLVSLTGDFHRIDMLEGLEGYIGELAMIGEDNVTNSLIIAKMSYNEKKDAALLLLNAENLQAEKKLELKTDMGHFDIGLKGEKIIIRQENKILLIDKNLELIEEMLLPAAIKERIQREPKYDSDGLPDIYFGGYDVSADFSKIVYSDEIGVKLYNLTDDTEILLSPTVPITGSELIKNSYHSNPRFVADDKKVITTMTAYEGTMGYSLCSLEDQAAKKYDISSDSSSTGFIRYDTGLLELNAPFYNEEKQIAEYKTVFLDYLTGELKYIKLRDIGDTGYVIPSDHTYVGQNYAAFITTTWDEDDYANKMSYINRINLKTFEVEPEVVSVKAAETHILGVLSDGRIIFSYDFYPSEKGICITNM
jgi:hypothetical protein